MSLADLLPDPAALADRLAEACGAPSAEEAFRLARAGDAAAIAGLERVGTVTAGADV